MKLINVDDFFLFSFHAYLAMSVYGDFMNTCPQTFLKGFTVLQTFEGGYIAHIPEMVS